MLRSILHCLLILVLSGFIVRHSMSASESRSYEIGLSMYSLRELFRSGELHAHDYPEFAKSTFGITKIDVWDGGYPTDWQEDAEFLPELKRRADAVGSEIFLVMAGTVNAEPNDDAILRANGLKFKVAVDQAVTLDSDFVRVFLKVDMEAPGDESVRRACVALRALADYAADRNITIAIEPSPNTPEGAYLAKVVTKLGHNHCKLMPDFGKMKGTDIYQGTTDMMPHTVVVSAKTHDIHPDGSAAEFDYPRLTKIIRDSGFSGIVSIEYEGANLGPVEGVRATQRLIE